MKLLFSALLLLASSFSAYGDVQTLPSSFSMHSRALKSVELTADAERRILMDLGDNAVPLLKEESNAAATIKSSKHGGGKGGNGSGSGNGSGNGSVDDPSNLLENFGNDMHLEGMANGPMDAPFGDYPGEDETPTLAPGEGEAPAMAESPVPAAETPYISVEGPEEAPVPVGIPAPVPAPVPVLVPAPAPVPVPAPVPAPVAESPMEVPAEGPNGLAAEEAQREKERQEADLLISLGRYKAIQVRVIVDFTGVPRSVVANFESRIELFLQLRSRWALAVNVPLADVAIDSCAYGGVSCDSVTEGRKMMRRRALLQTAPADALELGLNTTLIAADDASLNTRVASFMKTLQEGTYVNQAFATPIQVGTTSVATTPVVKMDTITKSDVQDVAPAPPPKKHSSASGLALSGSLLLGALMALLSFA